MTSPSCAAFHHGYERVDHDSTVTRWLTPGPADVAWDESAGSRWAYVVGVGPSNEEQALVATGQPTLTRVNA